MNRTLWIIGICLEQFSYLLAQPVSIKSGQEDYTGNPVIKNIFTADPCPLVHNDTLYLFTGHDEQNTTNQWFLMNNWHIFSTHNLYDYKAHGARLALGNFSWARSNAFAGHCIEYNGKFWWYVSIMHSTIKVGEGFAIGVAVAGHPLGPYHAAKSEPIITDNTPNSVTLNIDPAVFIDDDGRIYLFWGSWGDCRMVELDTNMVDLKGSVTIPQGLTGFFEAPFVHKRGDRYYLTYAAGYPSATRYATSTDINGPWTYRGVINTTLPNSSTNHQGIVEYKGNWYFVYHSAGLPTGGTYRRSVCIDKLEYDESGLIKPIVRTTTSVPAIGPINAVSETRADIIPVLLFPNPSPDGHIKITINHLMTSDPPVNITIYDRMGRAVYAQANVRETLDLNLSNGVYILKADAGKTVYNEKIIVL